MPYRFIIKNAEWPVPALIRVIAAIPRRHATRHIGVIATWRGEPAGSAGARRREKTFLVEVTGNFLERQYSDFILGVPMCHENIANMLLALGLHLDVHEISDVCMSFAYSLGAKNNQDYALVALTSA